MMTPEIVMEESELLSLEISSKMRDKAWLECQHYSNNSAAWNAYRHRLSLEAFIGWLRQFNPPDNRELFSWPCEAELPSFWEVLEGVCIQWGETKIVLISTEDEELETFGVPQEWVDVFAADYYVAVQVNLAEEEDESWLKVWGYTTHRELKKREMDERGDRAYLLDAADLIPDITMMLLARKFVTNRKAEVKPLPALNPQRAEDLLEKLSQPVIGNPRLEVSFEEWGGLIADDNWRKRLYKKRLERVRDDVMTATTSEKSPVNLGQWFENIANAGWKTVEELIEALGTPEPNLAYGFVGADRFRDVLAVQNTAVPTLIELLQSSKDKLTRSQIVNLLGSIAWGKQEAIAALTQLLNTVRDDDLRRQAAVNLQKIDPQNANAGVRRGKLIDLGIKLDQHQVALVVTLIPEGRDKTNVHLRVSAIRGQTYLPPKLQLIILNEKEETLLSTESGSADNAVQLEFRGDREDNFMVKVALGNTSVTEDFVL